MNILLIQQNAEHDANRLYQESYCMQRAFQTFSGYNCDIWGIGRSNYNKPIDFNIYDVIILLEQRRFDYLKPYVDAIKQSRAYKLHFAIDTHSLTMEPFRYIKSLIGTNTIMCSIKHHMEKDCIWFPNYSDSFLMKPLKINYRADIGFCGHSGGAIRETYLKLLDSNINGFKHDNGVVGDNMVNAINSYEMHFNFNVLDDINFRNFETISMGVPLITNYNYQYDELGFKDDINTIFYTSELELLDKVKYYLNNISKIKEIGNMGLELSKKHSCLARITHLNKFILQQ